METHSKQKVKTKIGELTAIFIQDKETGGYTAYFAEKPPVIADADTIEEAIEQLKESLDLILEYEEKIKNE